MAIALLEDQVKHIAERVTELEEQVQNIYGDEDDWKRMSKT
jgi:hypothetical protein